MGNFNSVILMGNLTRKPELAYTPKGTAVAKFGLAVNRKWKTEAGEDKEEVTFCELEAWGRTAETLEKYLDKGSPLFVTGRLKLDQWDDKDTGQKRSKLKVIVEHFQFIGAPKGGSAAGEGEQKGASTDQEARQVPPDAKGKAPVKAQPKSEAPAEAAPGGSGDDPDSIPF